MALPPILTKQIGPIPMWGWLVAGGAAVLVVSRLHGNPAASAVLNPAISTPTAPTDPTGGTAPIPVSPGSSIFTPGSGIATAPAVSVTDLLGGQKLSDFIGSLGPDYTQFGLGSGDTSVAISHSAQNVVDMQREANQLSATTAWQQNNYNYLLNYLHEAGAINLGLLNQQAAQQGAYHGAYQIDPSTGRIVSIQGA